jgi:hypothetical protein
LARENGGTGGTDRLYCQVMHSDMATLLRILHLRPAIDRALTTYPSSSINFVHSRSSPLFFSQPRICCIPAQREQIGCSPPSVASWCPHTTAGLSTSSGLCSLAFDYFCTNPFLEGKNLLVAKYRACCWPYDQKTRSRRLNSSAGDLCGWLMHLVHCNYPGCWDCCCHCTVRRRLINGH